jgi:hypothetical protein
MTRAVGIARDAINFALGESIADVCPHPSRLRFRHPVFALDARLADAHVVSFRSEFLCWVLSTSHTPPCAIIWPWPGFVPRV